MKTGSRVLRRAAAVGPTRAMPARKVVNGRTVLKSDIAAPVNGVLALLTDRRVTQYWDPGRVISADLVRCVNETPARYGFEEALPPGFIAWDVVAVFPKSAQWERDLPVPARYDGPVVGAIDVTRTTIAELLKATPAKREVEHRENHERQ